MTSDPVARAVFPEDMVAVVGNLVAAGGIALHQVTGSAVPDAVAALAIGASLAIVALDLARRNRDFLVGREAAPALRARLTSVLGQQAGITGVAEVLVTYLGPRRLWVVARIAIDQALDVAALTALLGRVERTLRAESNAIARVDLVPTPRAA